MNPDSPTQNSQQQYSVSIWEGVGVSVATITVIVFALLGLGLKTLRNAFSPFRAEAIAFTLIENPLLANPQYVFGINIGGVTVAVITSSLPGSNPTSQENPPEVSLIVAKARLEGKIPEGDSIPSLFYHPTGDLQVQTSRTEQKTFCGKVVPVTIQQGTLAWSDQKPSVPALRYNATVVLNNTQRYVELVTTAQDAEKTAETIFNSLQCKL